MTKEAMAKKKSSQKNQEDAPQEVKAADSLRAEASISSCMEAATTPCANIADVVDSAEISDMCAELITSPCKDEDDLYKELANSPCTDIATTTPCTDVATTEPCTDLAATQSSEVSASPALELTANSSGDLQHESGVTDLVAQQLRQMIEEGGGTATCASAGSFTGTHTMNLNVKAGAVDMNLSTVTEANQELIELKTQIELQKKLLADAQDRLDVANQRIGFLESELARKDREKQENSGWLKSLFGI
jgi:hypothetical protein